MANYNRCNTADGYIDRTIIYDAPSFKPLKVKTAEVTGRVPSYYLTNRRRLSDKDNSSQIYEIFNERPAATSRNHPNDSHHHHHHHLQRSIGTFTKKNFQLLPHLQCSLTDKLERNYDVMQPDKKKFKIPLKPKDNLYESSHFKNRVPNSRPIDPLSMSTSFQTDLPSAHNHKRALSMQRDQMKDQIDRWKIFYYGNRNSQENYKRKIRETLKDQMDNRQNEKKEKFERDLSAIQNCIIETKTDLHLERTKEIEKKNAQRIFAIENKSLMERKEQMSKLQKALKNQEELSLLQKESLNWSRTLK
ncbi:hypothetical protein SNEBB_001750 [Seison nebaliae]|nr:hypothetical protein SNEBB_001750 [Seison nebaliae]